MRTLRTNTWNKLNEKQKNSALLWTKQITNQRIILYAVPIVLFSGLYAIYAVARIIDGLSVIGDRKDAIMLLLPLAIVIICFSLMLKEIRKIIAIKTDKALITDVTVVSKEARQSRRGGWHYYVKVRGLIENNKPVEKEISISKNLYTVINANEKGYVIRFDQADNGKIPNNIGFFPK